MSRLWDQIKDRLKTSVEEAEFTLWIEPLKGVEEGGGLKLVCPNELHARWLRQRYLPRIRALLGEISPGTPLRLSARKRLPAPSSSQAQLPLPGMSPMGLRLNGRYRFDTFVTGRSNSLACSAARAMAEGRRIHTPTLVLVSGTGLGKSHLTQAVGHYLLAHARGARVAYLTVEDFASQMVKALRAKRMEEFKARFSRGCDVLLLEGIDFLSGKDKTQQELAWALEAMWEGGGRVVMTAYQPPEQIKGIRPALMSRLASGLTAAIDPPEMTMRIKILERAAAEYGMSVPIQVLEMFAERITDDIRRLRSALANLIACSELTGQPPGLELAEVVLGGLPQESTTLTPRRILEVVAKAYGLRPEQLTGSGRRKHLTRARAIAMLLCRKYTDASYTAIGRLFSRSHATVIHAIQRMEMLLPKDPRLGAELGFIERQLGLK